MQRTGLTGGTEQEGDTCPYAGSNRIRFKGFAIAGISGPIQHQLQATPRFASQVYDAYTDKQIKTSLCRKVPGMSGVVVDDRI